VYTVIRKARLTSQVVLKARCPGRLRIFNVLDLNVGGTRLKSLHKIFFLLEIKATGPILVIDSYIPYIHRPGANSHSVSFCYAL
jgi:hypothetical protein